MGWPVARVSGTRGALTPVARSRLRKYASRCDGFTRPSSRLPSFTPLGKRASADAGQLRIASFVKIEVCSDEKAASLNLYGDARIMLVMCKARSLWGLDVASAKTETTSATCISLANQDASPSMSSSSVHL